MMPVSSEPKTGAGLLAEVLTRTDNLDVSEEGFLEIEGHNVNELLSTFGSPLFVISEGTFRSNFRRVRRAFEIAWPTSVNVMYAGKANNNIALRAIISDEGGGGDCFGQGEIFATFAGGAEPELVALNGSNKSEEELWQAVTRGIVINIDDIDEIATLERICREKDSRVRVNIRLKIAPSELSEFGSDTLGVSGDQLVEAVLDEKWGFSPEMATVLTRQVLASPNLLMLGYHVHMGRIGRDPNIQRVWARAFATVVAQIAADTGFKPAVIDIGGGWARERDPESRTLELNPTTIEDYAAQTCEALLTAFHGAGLPIPKLWLEPGRYIAGNAGVLLATVGAVKSDLGRTWINVDASTNNLTRIDSSKYAHHVLPASKMHEPRSVVASVVGSTCTHSILASDVKFPMLSRGDIVAVLDAGMYAETTSNQYNGMPRPATVLVSRDSRDLIKRRETVSDVFGLHLIPERLTHAVEGAREAAAAKQYS